MKAKLDLIEKRLQALIEGGLTLLLPGGNPHNPQQALTRQLVEAMQANLVNTPDGLATLAPDTYNVSIHPSRLPYWQNHQPFLDNLTRELYQAGSEVGFNFVAYPHIIILDDESLPANQMRITATMAEITAQETSGYSIDLPPSPTSESGLDPIPQNAFLIVNGQRHFQLNQKVVNIGRRLDNNLVIDDPRVSRNHVQLRAINGHFIIFDLNATGGTFVNGKRVGQYTLNPGDVISLAGYPLIYGQDVISALKDTQSLSLNPQEDKNKPNQPGPTT